MATKTMPTNGSHPAAHEPASALGPRKTLFVLVTVVGCIAILWPKIFYPMMFSTPDAPSVDNYVENKGIKHGGPGKLSFRNENNLKLCIDHFRCCIN